MDEDTVESANAAALLGVPETMLSTRDVAALLGVPEATLRYWRYRDQGPRSFRVGRAVRYRCADVLAWLDAQIAATERGATS